MPWFRETQRPGTQTSLTTLIRFHAQTNKHDIKPTGHIFIKYEPWPNITIYPCAMFHNISFDTHLHDSQFTNQHMSNSCMHNNTQSLKEMDILKPCNNRQPTEPHTYITPLDKLWPRHTKANHINNIQPKPP